VPSESAPEEAAPVAPNLQSLRSAWGTAELAHPELDGRHDAGRDHSPSLGFAGQRVVYLSAGFFLSAHLFLIAPLLDIAAEGGIECKVLSFEEFDGSFAPVGTASVVV
jgi:hypothetical protein